MVFSTGALLLMFLTLLGGARNSRPLNEIYFLQVDTSNIPGAPDLSRWTYWQLCAVVNGKSQCGSSVPDYPFDPPSHETFDTDTNIPAAFIGTNHYYLTSRFSFPFLLIALFFGVVSLFTGFLAMCTRIGGYVSSLVAWIALIFQIISTCLITAVYVEGRNKFSANGQTAKLGAKAFAFMWTAVACLLIACVCYCMGGSVGRKERGYSGREHRRRGFFSSARRPSSVRSNKETAP
ncbi:SUR7-domain-containing protein [Aspergillus heteromorphus CBS 117.55]|uniref:SUR7-domain-containing protein n=1 Tax=Aspergillus heteromorphus CBS 117.55 TaxID=1448321 RepID=A0A317WX92_9EURO|nr:SUR7-domain-containing protein [Aspergillus heteromorphus CBS 117.55]PWY91014.1 SUR7-domain-containing protein [Aspergillus heteromorphus CBS 117.55]